MKYFSKKNISTCLESIEVFYCYLLQRETQARSRARVRNKRWKKGETRGPACSSPTKCTFALLDFQCPGVDLAIKAAAVAFKIIPILPLQQEQQQINQHEGFHCCE